MVDIALTVTAAYLAPPIAAGVLRFCRPGAAAKAAEGITVLGRYPGYLQKAEGLGAHRFNIPREIWEKMTLAERWAANQKFLDRTIARGDRVVFSSPLSEARPGSWFAREIDYLISKGFSPNAAGTELVRPR